MISKLPGGSVHWRMNRWQTKKIMSQKARRIGKNPAICVWWYCAHRHWAGGWLCAVWRAQPDPSEEIEQIIERKMEEADAKKIAEEEAAKGDSKVVKETPEVETFVTTYFEFPGTFTTNLLNSRNFCKLVWAYQHNMTIPSWRMSKGISLRLRSEILNTMSEFSEADVQGKTGREALAIALVTASI